MGRVLKHGWLNTLILFLAILGFAHSAIATTAIVPADDDMIIAARAIVIGRVISVATNFDENQNAVFTYTTLRVQSVLKGQITTRKITIKEMGGEAAGHGTIIFGTPQYQPGERLLLYLDTWSDGSLRTHQMFLGRFSIITDPQTGKDIVERNTTAEKVTVLGKSDRGIITDRMELPAYKRMVRQRLAANLEQAEEVERTYYSNTPILPRPLEFDAKSESGDLSPQFHVFSPPVRWFEPDSGQPVVFYTNTNGAPTPTTVDDILAAMNAWSTVAGCSLRVASGGTTTDCYQGSNLNTIVFDNCDGWFAAGSGCGGQGILARAGIINYTTGVSKVVNGTTFYKAIQAHMSFNPYASCYFSNHCNVAEVATHEMGHALGLHHSWDPTFGGSATATDQAATMYWIAHFDGRCAALRPDDVNGITFVYPGSGGGGPLSIVTSSLPGGVVSSSYGQGLVASGGSTPYTWSLVAGQGTLPAGLTLSGSGAISGTPTTAGTSNFTVKVTDAASATAEKALSIVVTAGGAPLSSQFVSQTVPTSVQPGQQFNANLKFLNTGTQTWSGSAYFLASQNPALNQTWGGNGVSLSPYVVAPGQQLDVTFIATAPSTPGTYNFQWQLYENGGVGFFGQMSTNLVIQVDAIDNAAFISQSVPATMIAGQNYNVSVTMQNTGTTTWTAAAAYRLGSLNPTDNWTWGPARVLLSSSVSPGSQVTLNFTVTAPLIPGTYNFKWGMVHDGVQWFGASSPNVAVNVTGISNSAQFISQVVPTTMAAGQTYNVSVTLQNTGAYTWTAAAGYRLGSMNPTDNWTWGPARVLLPSSVSPGSQVTFNFTVTAPLIPGTHNFKWGMVQDGIEWFGSFSPNVTVNVIAAPNSAQFISQVVPTTMTAGQSYNVSITMQNTGANTWTAATAYRLGSLSPTDNWTWGPARVLLPSSVSPGSQVTFSFTVTAPLIPGTYNFKWGMVQDGVEWFTNFSPNMAISVN